MKKLKLLLTFSLTFILLLGSKAANRTAPTSPTKLVSASSTWVLDQYLEKYWGFKNNTLNQRRTSVAVALNWGEEADWDEADPEYWELPKKAYITVTQQNTVVTLTMMGFLYSTYCDDPYLQQYQWGGASSAYIRRTGSTPTLLGTLYDETDCDGIAQKSLTLTLNPGTYEVAAQGENYAYTVLFVDGI
jgi:hypothetical protein